MMTRVWDRFLTAQDKAHLAQRRGDRRVGFGKRPAILNIDIYRGAFGDENLPLLEGVKHWPGYCGPAAWNTIPHVQALMREARAAGIPVCHATGLLDEDSGIPGWSEAIHAGSPRRIDLTDPAARKRFVRRFDIIDEVAPQKGDVVVRKTAPSAFWVLRWSRSSSVWESTRFWSRGRARAAAFAQRSSMPPAIGSMYRSLRNAYSIATKRVTP